MPRLVAWLSLLLLVACGSASPRIASPEATSWESEILGRAPDARLVLRLDKAQADPVYGGPPTPFDRAQSKDPELEALLGAVTSIEFWFVVDDGDASRSSMLFVFRGRPNLGYLQQHADTRAVFARQPERLPTGVLAYDVSRDNTPVTFFVLPSGAWVVATGRIVGRVRYYLFSHGEDPPPAPHEPDALLAMWVGPGATRLSDVSKHAKGFEELSVAIRSSARGDMEASVKFSSEKHAKEALAEAQAVIAQLPTAQKALADRCPAWEGVRFGLTRDGRALTGRVSNLPALVRAYRTGACRYEREDKSDR